MIEIISKSCHVTTAMQDAAREHFGFLNLENHEEVILRLTLSQLNDYTLQLKVFYQEPGVTLGKLEVLSDDYYNAIEIASKKLKLQLSKLSRKRQSHSKLGLGKSLLDLSHEEEPQEDESDIEIFDLKVPIYFMSLEEAIEQMTCLGYSTLMYHDGELETQCVLVRQSNNQIKRYVGVLA